MAKKPIYPSNKLTVIIVDYAPLHCAMDAANYRSVQIILTDEQIEQLALKNTGTTNGNPIYENIEKCFIEPIDKE